MQHCLTGLGGQPATVGLNAGDGKNFVNVMSTDADDVINITITSTSNIGMPGMWAFKVNPVEITGINHDTSCL